MKDHTAHPWIGAIAVPILIYLGIRGIFYGERAQAKVLDLYRHQPTLEKSDPFAHYVKSSSYIRWLRFFGVVSLGMAMLLLRVLLF